MLGDRPRRCPSQSSSLSGTAVAFPGLSLPVGPGPSRFLGGLSPSSGAGAHWQAGGGGLAEDAARGLALLGKPSATKPRPWPCAVVPELLVAGSRLSPSPAVLAPRGHLRVSDPGKSRGCGAQGASWPQGAVPLRVPVFPPVTGTFLFVCLRGYNDKTRLCCQYFT